MFVTAVVVDLDWSPRIVLSDAQWQHMYEMLHELDEIAREFGLVQVIHPHVGTLIETADDVNRVLANTSSLWCLDTGHLAMGGTDPVAFAETYGARVGHVHLKDVVLALAEQMNQGDLTLMQATFAGMFCNLGAGDVDVAGVMRSLSARNYTGWYVLEQDISINGEPPREGSGPVEDVAVSLAFARHHLGLAG